MNQASSSQSPAPHPARTVRDIDWPSWQPVEHATLLFVIQSGRILLILKKRGLGAGKINGPGGRLDPGETPIACAVREAREELLITPHGVRFAGRLNFQFVDGYSICGHVFTASGYEGVPTETGEAVPMWFDVNNLPFDRMWEDDYIWMPHLIAGRQFRGNFIFDGDRMLDHHVVTPDLF